MKNRSLKIVLGAASALAVGAVLYNNTGQSALYDAGQSPEQASGLSGSAQPVPSSPSAEEIEELDDVALLALLEDPRVQDYLGRQQDKQALEAYFTADDSALSDAEAWTLIESIERDGRVMAYEALALKLAWLERNSASEGEFQDAARDLVAEYRERAEQSMRAYDPYEDVPGFAEYKEAERRILQEVQAMESFPDGMTRQEYLRMRLQAAREAAYGS